MCNYISYSAQVKHVIFTLIDNTTKQQSLSLAIYLTLNHSGSLSLKWSASEHRHKHSCKTRMASHHCINVSILTSGPTWLYSWPSPLLLSSREQYTLLSTSSEICSWLEPELITLSSAGLALSCLWIIDNILLSLSVFIGDRKWITHLAWARSLRHYIFLYKEREDIFPWLLKLSPLFIFNLLIEKRRQLPK